MWSRKHKRCVNCGKTKTKHVARGLCRNCYEKATESKHKGNLDKIVVNKHGTVGPKQGLGKLLSKDFLIEKYYIEQKSLSDIAKECGCSRQFVYKKAKEHNLKLRNKGRARKIAYDSKKIIYERMDEDGNSYDVICQKNRINKSFFKRWSKEMAYVLGVIYTDGNLDPGRLRDPSRKTTLLVGRLTVSQKEPELLKKISSLMGSNAKLYHRNRTEYRSNVAGDLYWFHISNDEIYEDLENLGLTPKKSLEIRFPEIPDEFIRHFIRGCWDGDGSVFNTSPTNINASFISGSLEFIQEIERNLRNFGLSKRKIYIRKTDQSKSYSIKYPGRDCAKLYRIFYKDVTPNEYLKRKYGIFNNFANRQFG